MPTKKATAGASGIPLRLRRRRDGTMALIDHRGVVDAPERAFPAEHLFNYRWLLADGAGIVALDGEEVRVELVNARATYRISRHTTAAEDGAEGVLCELVSTELFDAPAIDQARADQIAAERSRVKE